MYDAVTIASMHPVGALRQKLNQGLHELREAYGIDIELCSQRVEGPAIIQCRFHAGTDESRLLCRRRLAEILGDLIVDQLQDVLLRQAVRNVYGDLDEQEQENIRRHAVATLSGSPLPRGGRPWDREARKTYVTRRLQEYLEQSDRLHLDGFIKFRIPDYLDELEEAVDRAVDELMIQREYRDFLRFLRSFVEMQSPRVEIVHVVLNDEGGFRLLDDEGHEIVDDDIREMQAQQVRKELESDDLLISALVSISPRQVLLHDPHVACCEDTTETLRNVFQRKIYVCRGCRLCDRRRRMK